MADVMRHAGYQTHAVGMLQERDGGRDKREWREGCQNGRGKGEERIE